MRAITRRFVPVLAVAGLLAACGQGGGGAQVGAEEMSLGKADAPVTVIEYASVTCPHCAAFNEQVYPDFKAKYIDTGQVRYVFREYLTGPVPIAMAGFLIARCAGKDKYFGVIDALFRSQAEMVQSDPRSVLFRVGNSAGLTNEQITACVSDQEQITALEGRVKKAVEQDKIMATPSFIINGKKLEGEQSLAQFDAAIQPLLKK
jgi:protein-disulfide isomerase